MLVRHRIGLARNYLRMFRPQPKIIRQKGIHKAIEKMDVGKNISKLKAKLDSLHSLYIRQRNADKNGMVKCFTSSVIMHWKEAHCGHFVSRRYLAVRWDDINCQVQSVAENIYNQGNAPVFYKRIDEVYGKGTAEKLIQKSKNKCKMTAFEYQLLIKETQQKLDKLNK